MQASLSLAARRSRIRELSLGETEQVYSTANFPLANDTPRPTTKNWVVLVLWGKSGPSFLERFLAVFDPE